MATEYEYKPGCSAGCANCQVKVPIISADSRAVATDALATLGTIINEKAGRDAIHLAVEPLLWSGPGVLKAGDHILYKDGKISVEDVGFGNGIVDPFLQEYVQPGNWFWFIIYPRQITSLRHVWEHPAFSNPTKEESNFKSKKWVKDYAEGIWLDYNELMEAADSWVASQKDLWGGSYLNKGGDLEGVYTNPEFWEHYEIIRGVKLPPDTKTNFFTCSC